ncbi:MAG: DUF2752 domain-containing protein [Muribaculaceae bacterium]|nr:DUF2752 domain-containing protein [Muribaculaceae bacterium]
MSKSRSAKIWVFVIVLVVVAFFYFSINPATSKYVPRCVFLTFTGFKCPGCGAQRAIHSLLHGNIVDALHYNAFFLAAVPVIALYLLNDYTKLIPSKVGEVITHHYVIAAIGVIAVLWWVLRNVFDW